MFNSNKQKYDCYNIQKALDDYRQEIETPIFAFTSDIAISLLQQSNYTANDFRLSQSTHIGFTNKSSIEKDMEVWQDGKKLYLVEFVNNDNRTLAIVYLKAVK